MLATLFSLAPSNLNIKNYFTFKARSYTSFPFFRVGVSCQVTLGKCKSFLSPLKSLLAFLVEQETAWKEGETTTAFYLSIFSFEYSRNID